LRHLHAAAAAAGGCLDQHREADPLGDRHRIVVGSHRTLGAGHHGNAELLGGLLGFDLVAHQADVLGLRADEAEIVLGEDLREARVLGEKAVAGMHGIGAGDLAGRKQGRDVEIRILGRRRPDAHALVGKAHMHGVGIGGGMYGNGGDAEFLASAQDAKCDLAAIGYQNFIEHAASRGE
jgi:hypothetical protein